MPNERKSKNEFGEDISWEADSDSTYTVDIQEAPLKGGQIARTHSHSNVSKKDENSQTKENGYADVITFGEGGNATYVLKVNGKVNNARIVRMHKCDE
jgi:hypothetical protein